jgi:hypothetical protein
MPHKVYDTPLAGKLGIRPGHRVCFLNAPDGFAAGLELPPGVDVVAPGEAPLDVVLLFTTELAALQAGFGSLAERLAPDGGLWVAYPKRAARVPTDLSFDAVQRLGLAAGLVDNKSCSVDAVYTALRFVYRRRDRPARAGPS